jgi:hypothetical protein
MSPRARKLVRAGATIAAISASVTAAIGALHLPALRPLLALVAKTAGCPVDLKGGDPVALERFRVEQLKQRVGDTEARSAPALGFELGVSTRADVLAWLGSEADRCESVAQGSALTCEAVKPPGEPGIDSLYVRFDAGSKLVALDLFRAGDSAHGALAHFARVDRTLGELVGPRTDTRGELHAQYLAAGRYRRVASEFRYKSYVASLSAMNFGSRGVRVRETYQYLPPPQG